MQELWRLSQVVPWWIIKSFRLSLSQFPHFLKLPDCHLLVKILLFTIINLIVQFHFIFHGCDSNHPRRSSIIITRNRDSFCNNPPTTLSTTLRVHVTCVCTARGASDSLESIIRNYYVDIKWITMFDGAYQSCNWPLLHKKWDIFLDFTGRKHIIRRRGWRTRWSLCMNSGSLSFDGAEDLMLPFHPHSSALPVRSRFSNSHFCQFTLCKTLFQFFDTIISLSVLRITSWI